MNRFFTITMNGTTGKSVLPEQDLRLVLKDFGVSLQDIESAIEGSPVKAHDFEFLVAETEEPKHPYYAKESRGVA